MRLSPLCQAINYAPCLSVRQRTGNVVTHLVDATVNNSVPEEAKQNKNK